MTKLIPILIFLSMMGCAVTKQLSVSDVSRTDGTVEFFYQHGAMEIPKVDWIDADKKALSKCKVWGYKSAKPIGSSIEKCISYTASIGCTRYEVRIKYECE